MKTVDFIRAEAQKRMEASGPSSVYEYGNDLNLPYRPCDQCDAETPHIDNECLLCGQSTKQQYTNKQHRAMDNKAQQVTKCSAGGSIPFYVDKSQKDDGFLILGDGGVVGFHHNGYNMVSTYYQSRIPTELISKDGDIDFDRLWDELSEGEVYLEDWDDEHTAIDDEMVNDAIGWLYCTTGPEPTFTKIDSMNEIGLSIKSGRY